MTTHAVIGIKHLNGGVGYIFCYQDGSPKRTGKTLLDHYNNEKSVRELLSIGDITSLKDSIGEHSKGEWGRLRYTEWLNIIEMADQLDIDYFYIFDIKKQKWTWIDVCNFNDLTPGDCI